MKHSLAYRCAMFVVCAAPAAALAQGGAATPCRFTSDRASADSVPGGTVGFLAGNVFIECKARGITLRGDSAERRPDGDHIIGHAVFDDPRFHVTSDFLNYFPTDERVLAIGNVNARLPSGSTMVGPIAEYKRAVPRIRTKAQMLARSRPTITIVEKDSAGRPVPPTTVNAETVFMDGDSLIYASGGVVITRPEIIASADSVFMDETKETMRLIGKPELKGKKEKPYTLTGDLIDLFSRNRKLQRVISRANAVAVSDSMTLKSDTIDLRVDNDLLQHAYAWGTKSRARAISPNQNLLADSIDVLMPAQKVRLIRALRKAFAEGKLDTTRFRPEKPDTSNWLKGDTIVAHFDTATARDTSKSPVVRSLDAFGNASAQYHMAASDTAERRPAVSYVVARLINIAFDSQRPARVTAVDSVTGLYLEPRADSTTRRNARPAPGQTPVPVPARPPSSGATPVVSRPPKKP